MRYPSRAVGVALALAISAPTHALDIDAHPALFDLMNNMVQSHGFKPSELRRWFEQVELKPGIITALDKPREALPWHEYKKPFVNTDMAKRGNKFWRKHADVLARAEERYGVAPEIVLAILGVETQYGRNTGRYRVIDALSTIALQYPKRADYFTKQLQEFLLLARELERDPLTFKGSYAGAMGYGQFMPSSYRAYAVDGDGDGERDLIGNIEDAIDSIANYFKRHGWTTGAPVISPLQFAAGLTPDAEALAGRSLSLEELKRYGAGDGTNADIVANVVRFQAAEGPEYMLAYPNFETITRYNRSRHYARAVYELAQLIKREHESEK